MCNTTEFRKDITELCEDCPLRVKIPTLIKEQIIAQAEERYAVVPESIDEYLKSEIDSAFNVMNKAADESKKLVDRMPRLSEIYIWSKERIKALRQFKEKISSPEENPARKFRSLIKSLSTDKLKSLHDFLATNSYVGPYTDYESFSCVFDTATEDKSQPIIWKGSKQQLRALVMFFKKDECESSKIERLVPYLFHNIDGQQIKLAKNKETSTQRSIKLTRFLAAL